MLVFPKRGFRIGAFEIHILARLLPRDAYTTVSSLCLSVKSRCSMYENGWTYMHTTNAACYGDCSWLTRDLLRILAIMCIYAHFVFCIHIVWCTNFGCVSGCENRAASDGSCALSLSVLYTPQLYLWWALHPVFSAPLANRHISDEVHGVLWRRRLN